MTNVSKGLAVHEADVPFVLIMWNREYDYIDRPAEKAGYTLCFVHGHDSQDPMADEEHIYNLDNTLGKNKNNQGEYTVLQNIGMVPKKEETFVQDRRALTDEAENAPLLSPELASGTRTQDESRSTFSHMMPAFGHRTVETFHEDSDSPVNQPVPENQVHEIKKLLCNYLKYLSSYPTVISTEQNIYFKAKDDCSVTINQSVVAKRLDEVKRSKFDKTCELLIKLKKNDGTFQTDIHSHDTKELLSAHRDNIAIRMLKSIRCILTLGCVPKWNFFSSRGTQVIEGINDVLRVTPTR